MFSFLYNFFIYEPLYNALIFLVAVIPGNEIGLTVIVLTIIVKLVLVPISHKSIKAQNKIKELDSEVKKIKEKYKNDKQEQAVKVMGIYKEHGVNPLSGVFLLLIQIPIILALYFVFRDGIDLNSTAIYSFTLKPISVNQTLFYIFDINKISYILAALVAISQFFQAKLSLPPIKPPMKQEISSFQDEFARGMNLQMLYILPLFIGFISLKLAPAISIYWITNNIFSIIHEIFVKREATKVLENQNLLEGSAPK